MLKFHQRNYFFNILENRHHFFHFRFLFPFLVFHFLLYSQNLYSIFTIEDIWDCNYNYCDSFYNYYIIGDDGSNDDIINTTIIHIFKNLVINSQQDLIFGKIHDVILLLVFIPHVRSLRF